MSDTPRTCSSFAPLTADGLPRSFDPAWRSETVLALAKGIETNGAFDRMPILADALEEAGCEDEVLLRHCRECERHMFWCWALGKALDRPEILPHTPTTIEPVAPLPRFDPSLAPVESGGRGGRPLIPLAVVIVALGMIRLMISAANPTYHSTPGINSFTPRYKSISVPEIEWTPPTSDHISENTYEQVKARYQDALLDYQFLQTKHPADSPVLTAKLRELTDITKELSAASLKESIQRNQQRKLAEKFLPPADAPADGKPR